MSFRGMESQGDGVSGEWGKPYLWVRRPEWREFNPKCRNSSRVGSWLVLRHTVLLQSVVCRQGHQCHIVVTIRTIMAQ